MNKKAKKTWKITGNIIYFLIRGIFATGTIIGIIGGYNESIQLMKLGLLIVIILVSLCESFILYALEFQINLSKNFKNKT